MTELEQMTKQLEEVKAKIAKAKAEEKRLARRSKRVLMSKSFADYKNDVIDKKADNAGMLSALEYEAYVLWFNKRNPLTMETAIELMENPTLGRPGLLSQGTFFRELAGLKDWSRVRVTNKGTGKREWIYMRVEIAALVPAEKTQAEIALGL